MGLKTSLLDLLEIFTKGQIELQHLPFSLVDLAIEGDCISINLEELMAIKELRKLKWIDE